MLVNLLASEDVINVSQELWTFAARLVIHHADAAVVHPVKTVDASTNGRLKGPDGEGALYVTLQTDDGKRCQPYVDGDELTQIMDDDLAVNEMQTTYRSVWQQTVESLVNGTGYGGGLL